MHAIYYLYNNTNTFSVGTLLKFIWLIWMSSLCMSTIGTPLSLPACRAIDTLCVQMVVFNVSTFRSVLFSIQTPPPAFSSYFFRVVLLFKQNDWMAGRQTMSMTNCFRQHVFGWQKKSQTNKQTNTNLSMIYCIFNAAFEPFVRLSGLLNTL